MPLFRLNKKCISHTYFNFKGNAEIFFDIIALKFEIYHSNFDCFDFNN